jgi:hypothetical protein
MEFAARRGGGLLSVWQLFAAAASSARHEADAARYGLN